MVFCRYDNLSYLCNFIDTLDLDNTSFFILLLVIKNTYLYFAKRVICIFNILREIKVLSINVAGKSVYDESPPEEGQDDVFDFDKVYGDYLKVFDLALLLQFETIFPTNLLLQHLSQYPNANFTEILQSAEDGGGFVTWILNPDLYKKARIEQICKVIK